MIKQQRKKYTLDELGELIVPHHLTPEESAEISRFIKADKEKRKLTVQRRNRSRVISK